MMTIVLLILAYLLGSIPSGLWIGQIFFKINLREHGSGNTGTTNTFRILGKKAGMATFVIDFFKGTIATLLPLIFHVQGISPLVFGLLAVIGHTFPVFAGFKGGKAVATSAGVIFGFAPLFCLYLAVVFFGTLYLGSMISLSSVTAALAAVLGVILFPLIFQVQGVSPLVFGLLAVIGHTFPVFAGFKGGKAVATSAGVIFGFAPLFCLYLAVVFFGTLYLGSMISLSSVTAALAAVLGVILFPLIGFLLPSYDLLFVAIILALASLIIIRHKDNINRIRNKTENLVPWGLNLTHQEPKQ